MVGCRDGRLTRLYRFRVARTVAFSRDWRGGWRAFTALRLAHAAGATLAYALLLTSRRWHRTPTPRHRVAAFVRQRRRAASNYARGSLRARLRIPAAAAPSPPCAARDAVALRAALARSGWNRSPGGADAAAAAYAPAAAAPRRCRAAAT